MNMSNLEYGSSIYLAGPMRGKPCMNFREFFHFEYMFVQSGYKVINPAAMDVKRWMDGEAWEDCHYPRILLEDLKWITEVDAVFFLVGWEDSPGASAEHAFATAIGKPCYYEEEKR